MNCAVGISRTSTNKANALRVLNAMYEDQQLYRLLCDGIEGEHYTNDENGYAKVLDAKYAPPAHGIVNDAHKLFGILHGIDKTFYNPAKDKALFRVLEKAL